MLSTKINAYCSINSFRICIQLNQRPHPSAHHKFNPNLQIKFPSTPTRLQRTSANSLPTRSPQQSFTMYLSYINSLQRWREWVRAGRGPLSPWSSRCSILYRLRQWFWGTGPASSAWSPRPPSTFCPPCPSSPPRLIYNRWRTGWRRSWRGRGGLHTVSKHRRSAALRIFNYFGERI